MRTKCMRYKLFSILILSYTLSIQASTIPAPDQVSIAKKVSHIFVGTVTAIKHYSENSKLCNQFHFKAEVEVRENIRGVAENTITLPVCIGIKGFNRPIERGREYIFLLNQNTKTMSAYIQQAVLLSFVKDISGSYTY